MIEISIQSTMIRDMYKLFPSERLYASDGDLYCVNQVKDKTARDYIESMKSKGLNLEHFAGVPYEAFLEDSHMMNGVPESHPNRVRMDDFKQDDTSIEERWFSGSDLYINYVSNYLNHLSLIYNTNSFAIVQGHECESDLYRLASFTKDSIPDTHMRFVNLFIILEHNVPQDGSEGRYGRAIQSEYHSNIGIIFGDYSELDLNYLQLIHNNSLIISHINLNSNIDHTLEKLLYAPYNVL